MNTSSFIRKNFRLTVLASVVAIGAFGASNSFAGATDSTTATSSVIEPIGITTTADLNFGEFAGAGGGTVTVTTNSSRLTSGPVLFATGAAATAAKFDVDGANDATYSITWTAPAQLTGGEGTAPMDLTLFSDLDGAGAAAGTEQVESGMLSNLGVQSIYLGGTLAVAENHAAGTYTGDVSVTVEYN